MHSPLSQARTRRAFTLTEILVVVAIIAILAALAVTFIFPVTTGRRRSNTELTIQSVYKIFQHQWSWVIAQAKQEDISNASVFANLYTLSGKNAGMDPSGERTRVIWIKLRLMEAFPMKYSEVMNTNQAIPPPNTPAPDPVWVALNTYIPLDHRQNRATYINYLSKVKTGVKTKITARFQDNTGNNPVNGQPNSFTESAACLLMALQTNRGGVSLIPDSLAYAIADTDGDGVTELVDAFIQPSGPSPNAVDITPPNPGQPQPLRFYRWAFNGNTQATLTTAASAAASTTNAPDQVDTHGTLLNSQWGTTFGKAYVAALRYVPGLWIQPPPPGHYAMPVIASAGSDGYFGLPGTTLFQQTGDGALTIAGPTEEADNIYSYNLKMQ